MKIYLSKAKVKPLDLAANRRRAQLEIEKAVRQQARLIIFPQGFLSGADLGIMAGKAYFAAAYNGTAQSLAQENSSIYILADRYENGFVNTLYHGGEILPADRFEIDGFSFAAFDSRQDLRQKAPGIQADRFVLNQSRPVLAGQRRLLHRMLSALRVSGRCTVVCNLGGLGFTSHPNIYMPCISFIDSKNDIFTTTAEEYKNSPCCFAPEKQKSRPGGVFTFPALDFPVAFNQNPLIPANVDQKEYCLDLFYLQSLALANRLDNLGMKKAVVAVSGGLDSALALLATVNAFDMLGLDRSGIIALSMPGFGTSDTTKSLGRKLTAGLGIELKFIDITTACTQALKDIGHDGKTADVTFENVQARMRTLNALNIANMAGGIMVGTGDLSEEALGFATYGGDRLAGYNVNSSISKTVIRTMLPYVTRLENLKGAKEAVQGILSIPVSPELLPAAGQIAQKTEDILAPYKLIDFFIYCFVVAGLSPIEMAQRASCVFEGEFSASCLREKAAMFARRFIGGQFKRSCAPEGARLTHAALMGQGRSLPSDCSRRFLLSFLNM